MLTMLLIGMGILYLWSKAFRKVVNLGVRVVRYIIVATLLRVYHSIVD